MFFAHNINISGQHYQTLGEVGYVVLDAEGEILNSDKLLCDIRGLSSTIRARKLNRLDEQ